jgi:uncharacterized membrane protein
MHFRERPWDLFLSGGYVTAIAAYILATGQGILVAVLLVFFVPGYLFVAAVFPKDGDLKWVERLALSLGLSIVIVPLLGLFLNFTWGIGLETVVLSVLIFSGGAGAISYVRRMSLPAEQRMSLSLSLEFPGWKNLSGLDKGLVAALVASILVSAIVLAVVVTIPRPGDRFTAFGILGPDGLISDYPTDLNTSEEGTVIIEVFNHEFERTGFLVRVDLVGVETVWNETNNQTETAEVNRTTLAWFNITLDHDTNWSRDYSFSIGAPGSWKLQMFLFKDGEMSSPYRSVHLFVTVRQNGV